ncbi:MAG: carbohydrate ABC transporter permease [Candidatus Omnitrophica bacterium]|nr:carbohydrate ABC transporter permease [Candidatus Omnitrophota bacterium]
MSKRIISLLKHSFMILISAACIFPLLWMISSSLKTQSTIFSDMSLFVLRPSWQNYITAWVKGNFGIYFLNSVFYTVTIVGGIVLVSSLAAYAFARLEFPFKNFLFLLLLAPMMIPIPGGFVALYVLLNKMHLINTRIGYILPQINAGLAMSIFLLKSFFEKIPRDLEDSARIDGCSRLGIYWHLCLPLAKPALAIVVIYNTLYVWNEYLLAMLILSDKSLMPLTRGLMIFRGEHVTQYPILMAGMCIATIPIIFLYLLMQKHIIKGVMAGAVKG